MTKIVIVGAGSKFGGRLSLDIMSREVLQDAQICLCDPHSERLAKVKDYVQQTVSAHGLPTQVAAGTDRTEFLPGASFVVTSISVGGGAYYGYPYKAEVEEFIVDVSGAEVEVELRRSPDSSLGPIISGIEILKK